jgi:nucleotide-binding universal stress UspA family protein
MAIKDVVVPVIDRIEDEPALTAVEKLSIFDDAHVAALLVVALPEPMLAVDAGVSARMLAEVIEKARLDGQETEAKLKSRPGSAAELRVIESWAHVAVGATVTHARHADLTVMALSKPESRDGLRREIFEEVLMGSGRAILAIPQAWRAGSAIRRVMIAWDGSREAVRAIAEAEPFLQGADLVVVATVDAKPRAGGVGEAPGADIAAHLARRNVSVEVRNLDGYGREPGEALLSAAIDMNADLIVMGAYRHARLQQAIMGGVTRTLLETSPIPMLLAH